MGLRSRLDSSFTTEKHDEVNRVRGVTRGLYYSQGKGTKTEEFERKDYRKFLCPF